MNNSKSNDVQTELSFNKKDYLIPVNHKARFFVDFMEESLNLLDVNDREVKVGRPAFSPRSMLKLIVYARMNHITSSCVIEDLAMYHDVYKFVSDYITPDERSIRRYKQDYKEIYNELLKMTLKKAKDEDLTNFDHVSADGSIKKAFNNLHNNISEKETLLLLEYYEGKNIDEDELEKLRRPVKKFMKNKKLDIEDKIKVLKCIQEEFKNTKQEKIPLNDIEARKMKGKRGNFKMAFNIQSAVDTETNLICAITVSQSPTDHYELPTIVNKAIKNIGKKPKYISADTIYLNPPNLSYLIDEEIEGLIPNRKQAKEDTGRLNEKPYHKDNFQYDINKDAFKCPEGQYLTFYKEYIKETDNTNNPKKISRLYNNYQACKDCKHKNKCITSKQSHRTITENGNQLQRAMYLKMEEEQYRKEYGKRSCVERPFGTLKIYYNMENEVVIGKEDTEDFLTLDALAYNINRLYNILYEENGVKEDVSKNMLNIDNSIQSELALVY